MTDDTCTFRSVEQDGTIREVALTPEQVFDLLNSKPISYFPRDERVLIDDDGRITRRESAVPQQLDDAA